MKNGLLQRAIKLNIQRKHRKSWQKAVSILSAGVVFCTTYALILPAITMEREAICGLEAHTHDASCYEQQAVYDLQCGLQLSEDMTAVVHEHNELCYDAEHQLRCTLEEKKAHTHTDACYEVKEVPCPLEESEGHVHGEGCVPAEVSVPVCTLEESQGHAHGEACYASSLICTLPEDDAHTHEAACYEAQLICTLPEAEGHTHGEACFAMQTVPCTLPEAEGHTHTDACVTQERVLVCTEEELKLHSHDESCYEEVGEEPNVELVLVCTEPVVIAHVHDEGCLAETENAVEVLTCDQEEHEHGEDCYTDLPESEVNKLTYICGFDAHTHEEDCYAADGSLLCSMPAHEHGAACVVADLDLSADVEESLQWEATLSGVTKTGNWPTDVVAIAESQVGYEESRKNAILEHEQLYGYTRYGQWYGEPYAPWNAMFVSFCVHYAGAESFPVAMDAAGWVEALTSHALYAAAAEYAPKSGDVIIFDRDGDGAADRVGLVSAVDVADGTLSVLEGDVDGAVAAVSYVADAPEILGYGKMPIGNTILMTYAGEGFTVTATMSSDAGISAAAEMQVREILPGTEEYETYYQQAVTTLLDGSAAENEEELGVSFARFFDISFLVDGETVEPTGEVDVRIHYDEAITIAEEDGGFSVHFVEDGAVEVLDTQTYTAEAGAVEAADVQSETVNTFRFTQNSFSVTGNVVSYAARATVRYPIVSPNALDGTGKTKYVVFARHTDGNYYAFDANGNAVQVTVNDDGTISCDSSSTMLWTFTGSDGTYSIANQLTGNSRRYMHAYPQNGGGVVTSGNYTSVVEIANENGEMIFRVRSNSSYAGLTGSGYNVRYVTGNQNSAAEYYLAALIDSSNKYHVWYDGRDGSLMQLYGAGNTHVEVSAGGTITLPGAEWQGDNDPTKYPYKLAGWYDINTYQYYQPGDQVTINQNTVFYADWIAASYDVGQYDSHVVNTVDTNDFITTDVFDYTALFNVQSVYHTGTITASGHTESWSIMNTGKVPYGADGKPSNTLGFMMVDYDNGGDISYANGRDDTNTNQGDAITAGLIEEVRQASGGTNLIDLLFNKNTPSIGKYYVGTGNHLYQYMDSTTPNYDGIHDGYYYLDARLNAASYNQSAGRFYLYDYLERTSDSRKDGGVGQYSDFLPFNSIYQFRDDQLEKYNDSILRTGYEYDAKDVYSQNGTTYSSADDAATNYWFGIRSDIRFFLPNDCGEAGKDEYDNYGNISTRGEHMIFDFHGDDDVWVFVDDELVLDIGGLHGVMFGQIDFSSGVVTSGKDGGTTTSRTFEQILGHNITEGEHRLTVYYMERGGSQSNCAIYFNIAPRYDLEITKEDIFTKEKLNGAVFSVYNDEACKDPAELWLSEDDYHANKPSIHELVVVDGIAKCWGIAAGKTYYIKETTPPQVYNPEYPLNDDILRVTLNNRGTASIETTRLNGEDLQATEGYAVIEQDVNNTLKIVSLVITNQRDMDTTEIRVNKVWDSNAIDLPNSLTVYLIVNGQRVGREAVLTEANGWTYTWEGLPKYEADGTTLIEYVVEEVQVAGFTGSAIVIPDVDDYIAWTKTDAMADSSTYLLVNSDRALTYNGSSFGWMDLETAKKDIEGANAQWTVETNQYGFRLTNGSKYSLTYNYNGNYFNGVQSKDISYNQVIYYLENRLVAHSHDLYFQLGLNGTGQSYDGLVFTLYRKDLVTGHVVELENTLVDNEDQTFVEVTKVWDDAEDHNGDTITVHLYANGKDTGISMELNAANRWFGIFDGLAYEDEDGRKIEYTVVEDEPDGYDASYEYDKVDGRLMVTWVKAASWETNQMYRIFTGAKALEMDSENALVIGVNDPLNQRQWWTPVTVGSKTVLKNSAGDYYLTTDGTNVIVTTRTNNASDVEIIGDTITLNGKFLQMIKTSITVSESEFNATAFSIARRTEGTGQDGIGATIVNAEEAQYNLPQTGGPGTQMFTFGGLLMLAATGVYMYTIRHKRQKGGR